MCGTYSPEKDFELILAVKIKTRHPIEGQFGSELLAICNPCGVLTASYFVSNLCFLFKTTPYGSFENSVPKVLTASLIDIVVFKHRKICPTGNRRNRALFTRQKKISAASQTVATARIAPKICYGQLPSFGSQCSRFHPNRFTFGRVIAERVNVLLPHRVFS